jgi:hypothetical protein
VLLDLVTTAAASIGVSHTPALVALSLVPGLHVRQIQVKQKVIEDEIGG